VHFIGAWKADLLMIATKYKLQGIICTITLTFQPSQAYVTFRQSEA
jgi:hypothetical protein